MTGILSYSAITYDATAKDVARRYIYNKRRREDPYLIHKLLLKGTVLPDMTHNLTDLGPLLSSLEGLTAAHSLPNILSASLQLKHDEHQDLPYDL